MTETELRPWQKQPEGDWQTWTVWGPRGTGKTWALHHAAIERALAGEQVAFFSHPNVGPSYHLEQMVRMAIDDFGLTRDDVHAVAKDGVINFASGGKIEINPAVGDGVSPAAETVLLDQREPGSILVPFHEMRRVGWSGHSFVPHSEHTLRDAT